MTNRQLIKFFKKRGQALVFQSDDVLIFAQPHNPIVDGYELPHYVTSVEWGNRYKLNCTLDCGITIESHYRDEIETTYDEAVINFEELLYKLARH